MSGDTAPAAGERPSRGARIRRGLWRWTKRIVLALVVLLLLVRVSHPLWLPPVLDRLVASRGLALEYRDLDLSVLGGRVDLSRVTLAPRAEEDASPEVAPLPPIAVVEYVGLDLDVSALFTGAIVVHRAVVDGVRLEVERDADGAWNFERYLAAGEEEVAADASEATKVADAEAPAEEAPLDFGLPVRVEAAALHGLRLHLVDALAAPPLDTVFHLDVAVVNLGDEELPTRIDVLGGAPELLDALRVEARARLGERLLDVEADVAVSGVRARRLAPYLAALGVEARAERIDFDAALAVDLAPREGDELLTTGEVRVRDVRLTADVEEALAVDAVTLEIEAASTRSAVLPLVSVRGVRGNAARRADGVLRVAGLDLVGTGAALDQAPDQAAGAEPEPPAQDADGAPFVLEVGRVAVEEVALAFDDASVTPAAALRVGATVDVRDLVLDPARPGTSSSIDVVLDVAEVGRLTLAGTAVPTGDVRSAELALRGTELTFAAVAPYLAAAGLESTYASGTLRLDLSASARTTPAGLAVDARIANVELSDGEARHFAFGEIAVEGVDVAENGDLRVAEVRLDGLDLPAATDAEGALLALGFRTIPPAAPKGPSAPAAAAPEPAVRTPDDAAPAPPPRIELGRLVWADSSLRFTGRHLAQPVDVALDDLTLTVTDLALGGDPAVHEPRPAQLEIAASVAGLAESLSLSGEVLSRPGDLDVEARIRVTGSGLRLAAIEGLLADLGLESTLAAGSFDLRLDAAARQDGERLLARAELADVRFADGEVELLALDRLVVGEVDAGPDGISVASVDVRGARTAAARRADGALELLGLRVLPGGSPAKDPAEARPAPPTPPTDEPPPAADGAQPRFALGRLAIEGVAVAWRDAAVEPAVDVALELTADLRDVRTGPDATPLTFDIGARVVGVLEELTLRGSARLDPANLELDATLAATGLRADLLAGYVPPGIRVDLADGRFDARLVAGSRAIDAGGRDARLALTQVALRDAPDAEPLFTLDALRVDATRLDGEAGVYEVERAATEGLAIEVRRTAAGLKVPGATIVPAPVAEAVADAPLEEVPVEVAAPPAGDAGAAVGVATPPTIRLGALDLGLARLRFVDEVGGGEPLEASLALVTESSQLLCSPEPEELPPLRFAVVGAALPLVEGIRADLALSPFLSEPEFALEVGVNGVRGDRLVDVLPELAEALDADALESGTFTAATNGVLRLSRRGPADFDLSRGFGAELAVADVTWRARPDGEVLAGIERIDVDVRRVRPATGDVHVGSVEVVGIVGRVGQETGGMRVAGLLLRTPPEPAEIAADVESAPEPAEGESADADAANPAETVGPEFRLDRLVVQGLDFEFADTTVEPPMIVPIDDLEVEVRGFTTRAFEEPRAVTFRALVDAGAVELAERTGADNLLSGVLGSVANAVSGAEDRFDLESRRVWEQLEVQGRLRFVPALAGRVELDLLGLELPAFAGPAAAGGVDIGDGLVDTKLGLRFRGDDGLGVDLRTTASYLSLSEPPGGPISTYLKLPAPLDTVLFLLRDESGRQTIPVRLDIGADGISVPAVAGAVGTAIGQVLADAISAAPLRLLSPLNDVVGFLGLTPAPVTAETVVVPYGPGVALAGDEALRTALPLVDAMRADPALRVVVQHQLGGGDIDQAARLANPDPARAEELVTRLRDRKAALRREWGERAALTRAQYAVGSTDLAEAGTAHLRELDAEIVATEAALDRVFDLLRPGAERRREQRTRAAALALAELRLERIRAAILRRGGRDLEPRLDFRRPRFVPAEGDDGGSVTFTPRRPE